MKYLESFVCGDMGYTVSGGLETLWSVTSASDHALLAVGVLRPPSQ